MLHQGHACVTRKGFCRSDKIEIEKTATIYERGDNYTALELLTFLMSWIMVSQN